MAQEHRRREGLTPGGRMPRRFLTATVLLSAIVLAWLGLRTYGGYRLARQTTERASQIERLRGTITHLDEVLTMSARMAAVTGEPEWEERYQRFEQQYVDRIFGVFQRLHTRGEYPGTGIGLATCRKIVQRHGGTITARSAPGQGAAFIVSLPARQPAEGSD